LPPGPPPAAPKAEDEVAGKDNQEVQHAKPVRGSVIVPQVSSSNILPFRDMLTSIKLLGQRATPSLVPASDKAKNGKRGSAIHLINPRSPGSRNPRAGEVLEGAQAGPEVKEGSGSAQSHYTHMRALKLAALTELAVSTLHEQHEISRQPPRVAVVSLSGVHPSLRGKLTNMTVSCGGLHTIQDLQDAVEAKFKQKSVISPHGDGNLPADDADTAMTQMRQGQSEDSRAPLHKAYFLLPDSEVPLPSSMPLALFATPASLFCLASSTPGNTARDDEPKSLVSVTGAVNLNYVTDPGSEDLLTHVARSILGHALTTAQSGRLGLVLLEGEMGVGKSRCLKQVAAKSPMPVVFVTALQYDLYAPFSCVASIINQLMEQAMLADAPNQIITPSLKRQWLLSKLRLKRTPEHPEGLHHLAACLRDVLPELEFSANMEKSVAHMSREQRLVLAERLLLLVMETRANCALTVLIDNAIYIDRPSWSFLLASTKFLAQWTLVFASRPLHDKRFFTDRSHCLVPEMQEVLAHPALLRLTLAPRPDAYIVHLATQQVQAEAKRLGVEVKALELPLPLQQIILRKAKGSPLITKELIFELFDKDVIQVTVDKSGQATVEIAAVLLNKHALVPLPASVVAVLGCRLDRFSLAQVFILKMASLLDRRFPFHRLAALYPLAVADEQPALASELAGLVALQVLNRKFDPRGEVEALYSFASGFYSELAHARMLRSQIASSKARLALLSDLASGQVSADPLCASGSLGPDRGWLRGGAPLLSGRGQLFLLCDPAFGVGSGPQRPRWLPAVLSLHADGLRVWKDEEHLARAMAGLSTPSTPPNPNRSAAHPAAHAVTPLGVIHLLDALLNVGHPDPDSDPSIGKSAVMIDGSNGTSGKSVGGGRVGFVGLQAESWWWAGDLHKESNLFVWAVDSESQCARWGAEIEYCMTQALHSSRAREQQRREDDMSKQAERALAAELTNLSSEQKKQRGDLFAREWWALPSTKEHLLFQRVKQKIATPGLLVFKQWEPRWAVLCHSALYLLKKDQLAAWPLEAAALDLGHVSVRRLPRSNRGHFVVSLTVSCRLLAGDKRANEREESKGGPLVEARCLWEPHEYCLGLDSEEQASEWTDKLAMLLSEHRSEQVPHSSGWLCGHADVCFRCSRCPSACEAPTRAKKALSHFPTATPGARGACAPR
jgi:hypothetical protein